MKRCSSFWAVLICLGTAAYGQSRGTITGVVTDPTGASVPAAKVQVRAPAIGLARETTTNENGYFTAPSLPAGNYDVLVEAAGFKSLTRSGLRLDADAVLNLTLQLE
ncbi:MAG: carboxypeptidase-like regulatory domain-containing protein, partial [Bryobacteraceae bacterium]